jgi:hypothetical protein
MVIAGKPNLEIRLLTDHDYTELDKFLLVCKTLGLNNNQDQRAIKLDKMSMPYGQYFIGWDSNAECIWNLAGVHHLPEIGPNVWRCLFRGAQIPGYALGTGKDFLRVSYHWRYFLPLQIMYIQAGYPDAQFVITTNVENHTAGKSDRLDKIVMPLLLDRGIVSLHSTVELYNTQQNIWLVNVEALTLALAQYQLSPQT